MKFCLVILLFINLCILFSCKTVDRASLISTDSIEEKDTSSLAISVRKVFYSIPTPIETVFLIKSSGAVFEKDILNPISHLQHYTTLQQKATVLGLYSLDLCYVNLHHQRDLLLAYLTGIKKLSADLDILADFDKHSIEEIQQNIEDHEFIFKQISNRFLKNANQQTLNRKMTGAYIVVGAFIEGLFVTLHHAAKQAEPNVNLVNCLAQHSLSLRKINSLFIELKLDDLGEIQQKLNIIQASIVMFENSTVDFMSSEKSEQLQIDIIEAFKIVRKLRLSFVE